YAFVPAIGPDRFRVAARWLGGRKGSEDFSGVSWGFEPDRRLTQLMQPPRMDLREGSGVIDISGRWIEPPRAKPEVDVIIEGQPREFDKDNPSMRWAWRDNLWGLQRPDGSWLVEPKFQQADRLIFKLTRVMLNGKVGFIDREANLAIQPVFDEAWPFSYGFDRTAAVRNGVPGVIDKTGALAGVSNWPAILWASCRNANDRRRRRLDCRAIRTLAHRPPGSTRLPATFLPMSQEGTFAALIRLSSPNLARA